VGIAGYFLVLFSVLTHSGVELTVLLIDLDYGSVRRSHEKRPPPFLVDDRAVGREASRQQALRNRLERLVGHEAERQPFATISVGCDRGVVETKLAARRRQLDPMPRT
jgi:hypothetical protein